MGLLLFGLSRRDEYPRLSQAEVVDLERALQDARTRFEDLSHERRMLDAAAAEEQWPSISLDFRFLRHIVDNAITECIQEIVQLEDQLTEDEERASSYNEGWEFPPAERS